MDEFLDICLFALNYLITFVYQQEFAKRGYQSLYL